MPVMLSSVFVQGVDLVGGGVVLVGDGAVGYACRAQRCARAPLVFREGGPVVLRERCTGTSHCLSAVRAPIVHGDCTVAERLRRDKLEPPGTGQPALVKGRAVASDPGVDEEVVLIDQFQSIQLGR
jgi:hypothetical protein